MSQHDIYVTLLFITAGLGVLAFLLVIVGMILAPLIIEKVDRALGPLASDKELFFKGLPLSAHRMSGYGLKVLSRNTQWGQHRIYRDRPDRVHAVERAPAWILNVVTWIYASFVIVAPIAFLLAFIVIRLHDSG
ncbi:hypothetical protein [Chromohalobacter israelensis]|uniref:Uncharacterized protein n=1 Tax=Chromohalobacter israelensis (strain ATCC BAA-138 / DSM 3043 / CIP 106854 / NCIMB 13768 / 1H11) TaxID=290398 RepID=Q1R0T1_CHRI1|nr:hypothetical protein [Chromohalobacter salexigens]ABE57677.1 hypothetical protein Csal_0314 [Chromohalobacter salexigens DSM 3043]